MRLGRRLHHTGFLQPRQPAFWLFVLIVGVTGVVTAAEQSLYRNMSPSGWALSWFLLALCGLPVVLVVYVLDLYEREPVPLLAAVFVWGAVAATLVRDRQRRVGPRRRPPRRPRVRRAMDRRAHRTVRGGDTQGVRRRTDLSDRPRRGRRRHGRVRVRRDLPGSGFAIVEDVFYFMAVFGGQPSGVLQGFWLRVVASGLYGHVLYSGLVGMAIGVVVSRRAAGTAAGIGSGWRRHSARWPRSPCRGTLRS